MGQCVGKPIFAKNHDVRMAGKTSAGRRGTDPDQRFGIMRLPSETLLDSLRCLDRSTLDPVQISSKPFRHFVADKLSQVCLRRLRHASVTEAWHGNKGKIQGSYKLSVLGQEEVSWASIELEKNAGERFAKMIASSHISGLTFLGVPLTDRLFRQLRPALANVHVDSLLVQWCDYASISARVFVDTITSLGSVHDVLRISDAWNILPGHVNNRLVNYAAEHRTREVHLPLPRNDASFDVTDESILKLLTMPKNGPEIRQLEISKPSVSARFLERLVEAHRTGRITSNIDMNLWGVVVPHPSTNCRVQSAVATVREVKHVTKFGLTDIEYEGRNAGLERKEE